MACSARSVPVNALGKGFWVGALRDPEAASKKNHLAGDNVWGAWPAPLARAKLFQKIVTCAVQIRPEPGALSAGIGLFVAPAKLARVAQTVAKSP